uniref:MICOS complex subunit MIC25 isoform X6 n=1 Tax=Phascolarctos cinereus TaxID=38626 RepID=A0A6P5JRC4_PHACI|nr:MICOS complex subunit MIC25 isoform X6 [Phascolarctos cinereus]
MQRSRGRTRSYLGPFETPLRQVLREAGSVPNRQCLSWFSEEDVINELSEDVVNRMKDPSASSKVQQPSPASPPPASTSTSPPAASSLHTSPSPPSFSHSSSFVFGSPEGKSKHPRTDPKPPKAESQSSQQPSEAEEDLYRRYEQEKAMIQEELLQLVKREREVAREHLKSSLPWEKKGMNQEKQRSAQLAKELEGVEAELRRRDIFYKEQLGRIERKNAEMYKLSSQRFHEAATQLEDTIKSLGECPKDLFLPATLIAAEVTSSSDVQMVQS